jgi:hypothetical protein
MKVLAFFCMALTVYSCSVSPYAPKPEIKRDAPLEERQQLYKDYEIHWSGNIVFGASFRQGKRYFSIDYIRHNLRLVPENRQLIAKAELLELFGQIIAGVGFSTVGYGGYSYSENQGGVLTPVMLGSGVACLVLGIVFITRGHSYFKTGVNQYNNFLTGEFDLGTASNGPVLNLGLAFNQDWYNAPGQDLRFEVNTLSLRF